MFSRTVVGKVTDDFQYFYDIYISLLTIIRSFRVLPKTFVTRLYLNVLKPLTLMRLQLYNLLIQLSMFSFWMVFSSFSKTMAQSFM